jgi:hypothetical protein
VEQDPSWEGNIFSASHEMPHDLLNPKLIIAFPSTLPILFQATISQHIALLIALCFLIK